MATNKVYPRILSKSNDARLRKKTEMLDAVNVRAYESNDEYHGDAGEDTSGGNEGILKPVRGNDLVGIEEAINDPEGRGRTGGYSVIGSVSDEARDSIYYFMWHSDPTKHAVLRYVDGEEKPLSTIIQTKWLNFYYNSVVQGSITHVSSAEYGQGTGEKAFLYFTDNYNEPRCLDIEACLTTDLNTLIDKEIVEFISLCPITPTRPIFFEWDYDPSITVSNFANSRGIQFAYQNVFKNGTVSAFSVYSKLAVNPAYLSQGSDPTPEVDAYNYIKVRIPTQSENVESIRLYGREGNQGPWFFIDDFRESETATGSPWYGPNGGYYTTLTSGDPAVPVTYNTFKYYNNNVVSYVPEDITFKQFDSVPKLAEAIALSNDRIFMGNYVEGFDKVDVSARLSYISRERPDDFTSLDINLFSEVREIGNQGGVKNRISGYRLDMSNAPASIEAGTTLNINITVNPDANIHLYQSKDSFHSSVFTTFNDPNDSALLQDQVTDPAQQSSTLFNPMQQCAGKVSAQTRTQFGKSFTIKDIGFDPLASVTGTSQNQASASWSSTDGEIEVAYGTSASNPLIIQGKPMSFFVRLFINNTVTRSELSELIGEILSGKEVIPPRVGAAGPGQIVSNNVLVLDIKNTAGYQVNCGLGDLDYINTGDSNSRKICFVVDRSLAESGGGPEGVPPCGYFILNRADVVFGLNRVKNNSNVFDRNRRYADETYVDLAFSGTPSTQVDDIFFSLDLKSISNEQVLTCLPDIKGGYMNTSSVGVSNITDDGPVTLVDANVSRPGSNTIDRWVCLSSSTAYRLKTGSVSPSETLGRFGRVQSRFDVGNIIDGTFIGGQYADLGKESIFLTISGQAEDIDNEVTLDTSVNSTQVDQIKKLVGFLKFPGRSVSAAGVETDNGVVFRDGNDGQSIISTLQVGSIACTRDRIISELNRQFESDLNEVDNAQGAIIDLLGYTVVDGESGPGGNVLVGSINSSMVRDGLLYHYAQQGLVLGNDPFDLGLAANVDGANGNLTAQGTVGAGTDAGAPLALGYFTNVFDNYLGYLDTANQAPGSFIEGTNANTTIEAYDGQLDKDIRLVSENLSVETTTAGGTPLVTVAEGVYQIVNPLGWYRQFIPNIEITLQQSFIQFSEGDAADRKTFKSNANHSFGIVYSDFYGRQSSVFPLGSAFVPPYEQQSNGNGGAVDMQISLDHDPPEWAHSYQMVYGGNTSYNQFIQYSAGGAFILPSVFDENDDQGSVSTGNIYVSLNYLQENPDVSYAKAFGAKPSDGSDRFYEYRQGDKLRIISYYEGGARRFANNYVFDVVGTATFGDSDNPLHPFDDGDGVPNFKKGSFVILRNNPQAVGFSVSSIRSGGNTLPSTDSLWNNRCVFELYSPASSQDLEDRPFYEMGESYKVIKDTSGAEPVITHQYNPMVLTDGDVYFRRHAVNLPTLSGGQYQSIINEEAASTPSFFNYYLESSTFNDNIINADQHDYGRIKAVVPNASEIRRYASVIFSDQDDYSDTQLRLNSFDATKRPFKDLPNTYGNIGCILDYNDSLFVLQQTKVSQLPVNRTILSDVSGNDAVVATSKVLGNQRYYAGENGCDTNPESVAVVGNTIYWANKKKAKVYKFNPANGITAISDIGMKSYFKDLFDGLSILNKASGGTLRVVGGYDPTHDEYILSAYDQEFYDFTPDVIPDLEEEEPEEDTFDDQTIDTTGDLTAEEEAALQASLDAALANQANNLATIAQLQQDIQDLLAQINTETDNNDGIPPESIYDLNEEIIEINNEADALATLIIENVNAQVADHQATLDLANTVVAAAETLISQIDFDNPIFDPNSPFADLANQPVTFLGNDYDTGLLAKAAVVSERDAAQAFADAYLDGTAQEEVRAGDIFSFTIGYGAGPNPDPTSFIAQNDNATYNSRKNELNLVRQAIATFGTTELIDDLKGDVETLTEEVTSLEGDKQDLLNQIYQLAFEMEGGGIPDVDVPNPNDIDDELADFTEAFGEGVTDGDLPNGLNIIKAITDTGGDLTQLEDIFFTEGAFTGLPSNAISDYISVAVKKNLTDPSKARRIFDYNQIEPLRITRDSFAQAFVDNLAAQQLASSDSVTDLLDGLNEYLSEGIAGILVSDPSLETVFSTFDVDGNGTVTLSEIETVFPITAFENALEDAFTIEGGGPTVLEGPWIENQDLRDEFGELINDILDVGEQLGLENASDETGSGPSGSTQTGFSLVGIGELAELREIVNSPLWAEGDVSFITDAVATVRRRIIDDSNNVATISKLISTIEDKFVEINTRPAQEGYNKTIITSSPSDQANWASRFRFNSSGDVWSESWHNAVGLLQGDLNDVLQALKDFQNLTAAVDENDISSFTSAESGQGDVTVTFDTPPSLSAQNRSATNLDGPTAGDLLTGQNFTVVSTNETELATEVHSAFYGLSAAMDRANKRINDLVNDTPAYIANYGIRVSNPAGEDLLATGSVGSFVDLPEEQQNLRAIISDDTSTDLAGSFGTLTADDVATRVSQSLNPDSEFFNTGFAEFVRSQFVLPAQASGNLGAASGDLDGDGAVATADLLEFLTAFGNPDVPTSPDLTGDFALLINDLQEYAENDIAFDDGIADGDIYDL